MFERFSDAARQVVVRAQEEARLLQQGWIGDEHLFLALIGPEADATTAAAALSGAGVTLDAARAALADVAGAARPTVPGRHIPFTDRGRQALARALSISLQLGDDHVDTYHLLLAVIEEPGPLLRRVIDELGIDVADLVANAAPLRSRHPDPGGGPDRAGIAGSSSFVTSFPAARRPLHLVACGFCGRPSSVAGALVTSGSGSAICAACVDEARMLLAAGATDPTGATAATGLWRLDPSTGRAVPAMSAAGEADAIEAIRAVFAGLATLSDDGADAVSVDRGDGLGPLVLDARGRVPDGATVTFVAEHVELLNPDLAAVAYCLRRPATMDLRLRGHAVRVDGRWLASRDTLVAVLRLAGVAVPPDTGG